MLTRRKYLGGSVLQKNLHLSSEYKDPLGVGADMKFTPKPNRALPELIAPALHE